ncbi:uncharacterized protein LOC121047983 [Ixodes scapularis]|uniref:uncharacterized protein LOC121047983 n=1 Tax=Ixodes scapularis TaxID=6945 RepID=UPI001AD7A67D|nr:uncharacterized protein LOC121047983 [Ixodes scapularis]
MPWYAEDNDGLEDMSDNSGDSDSETSSDMEEGSDLCFQAASDVGLDDDTEDDYDAPGEPDSSYVLSANESFLRTVKRCHPRKRASTLFLRGSSWSSSGCATRVLLLAATPL